MNGKSMMDSHLRLRFLLRTAALSGDTVCVSAANLQEARNIMRETGKVVPIYVVQPETAAPRREERKIPELAL